MGILVSMFVETEMETKWKREAIYSVGMETRWKRVGNEGSRFSLFPHVPLDPLPSDETSK